MNVDLQPQRRHCAVHLACTGHLLLGIKMVMDLGSRWRNKITYVTNQFLLLHTKKSKRNQTKKAVLAFFSTSHVRVTELDQIFSLRGDQIL